MIEYLIIFTLSIICITIATINQKNKLIFYIFSAIGIILPCWLASVRDYSMGTDVNIYIAPLYNQALEYNNFFTYVQNINSSIRDYLYLLNTFICAKIEKNNIGLLFFMNELLVILPLYISLIMENRDNNKYNRIFGIFLFYMFWYNGTFNMARQSIALSFFILCIVCLRNKKTKTGIILFLIATQFHHSAWIGILPIIMYRILSSNKISKKNKRTTEIIIFLFVFIVFLFYKPILRIVSKIGIASEKIENVLSEGISTKINTSNTLFFTYLFIILAINKNILKNKDKEGYEFFIFSSLLFIFILQFGTIIKFSERMGYYLIYPAIFIEIPKLTISPINGKTSKEMLINTLILISLFLFYWFYWIIFLGYHATYPFKFR